ncbi:MAG TPA: hypothetical protein VM299_06095, partial [Solirubrobacteraceae bacterium]|nr:hypothetical protein [Solirubrobacteraceae bacterium]
MRPDVETATARVIAVYARLTESPGGVPLQKIEDELCVGYAHALAGDACLAEMEQRLQALVSDPSLGARRDLNSIAGEHAELQRGVVALRRELARLRREHDRLRAGAQAVMLASQPRELAPQRD